MGLASQLAFSIPDRPTLMIYPMMESFTTTQGQTEEQGEMQRKSHLPRPLEMWKIETTAAGCSQMSGEHFSGPYKRTPVHMGRGFAVTDRLDHFVSDRFRLADRDELAGSPSMGTCPSC
jgi:hypothetical protein